MTVCASHESSPVDPVVSHLLHIRMSSVHFCHWPSTISSISVISSRLSSILQTWPNSCSFLLMLISITVSYRCTVLISAFNHSRQAGRQQWLHLVSTGLHDNQQWQLYQSNNGLMQHACTAHPQSHPQTIFTGSFRQAVAELPAWLEYLLHISVVWAPADRPTNTLTTHNSLWLKKTWHKV